MSLDRYGNTVAARHVNPTTVTDVMAPPIKMIVSQLGLYANTAATTNARVLQSVAAFIGVCRASDTSEKKVGSDPSSPIAIMIRDAFTNTTLAMPNPPQMNPNATRIVTTQLLESMEMNTPMFGEYVGAMPPELYA